MKKFAVRVVVVALTAVALVYGGILLWTKVLHKPDEKLDTADLSQTLDSASPATTSLDGISVGDTTVAPTTDTGVTGMWQATSDSTVGYRVKEVLGGVDTEGVGRTTAVAGSLTIEGRTLIGVNFSVDVATIKSDESKRDSKFAGEIMETDQFPEALFRLTSPVELPSIPTDGQQIEVNITGELTLHGVAKSVTFPVTAEFTNGRIGVLGNIEVAFADFGIDNPSNGFVTTGDTGLIEFILVFERL